MKMSYLQEKLIITQTRIQCYSMKWLNVDNHYVTSSCQMFLQTFCFTILFFWNATHLEWSIQHQCTQNSKLHSLYKCCCHIIKQSEDFPTLLSWWFSPTLLLLSADSFIYKKCQILKVHLFSIKYAAKICFSPEMFKVVLRTNGLIIY